MYSSVAKTVVLIVIEITPNEELYSILTVQ